MFVLEVANDEPKLCVYYNVTKEGRHQVNIQCQRVAYAKLIKRDLRLHSQRAIKYFR